MKVLNNLLFHGHRSKWWLNPSLRSYNDIHESRVTDWLNFTTWSRRMNEKRTYLLSFIEQEETLHGTAFSFNSLALSVLFFYLIYNCFFFVKVVNSNAWNSLFHFEVLILVLIYWLRCFEIPIKVQKNREKNILNRKICLNF